MAAVLPLFAGGDKRVEERAILISCLVYDPLK